MKKFILISLMCLISFSVKAACKGGDLITSNTANSSVTGCNEDTCTGTTFCVSKEGMNWWSAFRWCEANNMELVSLSVACPSSFAIDGEDCPNLLGVIETESSGWTSDTYLTNGAERVYFPDGKIYYGLRHETEYGGAFRALCK